MISLKLGPFLDARSHHTKHSLMGIFDRKLKTVFSDIVDRNKFTQVMNVKEEETSKTHTLIFQDFANHIKTVNSMYPDGTFQWKYCYFDINTHNSVMYIGMHTRVDDQGITSYFFIKIFVLCSIGTIKNVMFSIYTGNRERYQGYYDTWDEMQNLL